MVYLETSIAKYEQPQYRSFINVNIPIQAPDSVPCQWDVKNHKNAQCVNRSFDKRREPYHCIRRGRCYSLHPTHFRPTTNLPHSHVPRSSTGGKATSVPDMPCSHNKRTPLESNGLCSGSDMACLYRGACTDPTGNGTVYPQQAVLQAACSFRRPFRLRLSPCQ